MTTESGRYLWALGGKFECGDVIADISVYDTLEDRWISSSEGVIEPLPHPVQGAGWAYHDGKIYGFGGKSKHRSGCTDHVQVYDIKANMWSVLDPLPAPRSKLSKHYPVINGRYVYVFGGDSERGAFSRVDWIWRFDLIERAWKTDLKSAPHVQSYPIATAFDGWLYYTTGNTGQGMLSSYPGALNQRYHPEEDRWEVMAPCPMPVTDGDGDRLGDELHIVGGWNTNPWYYNPLRRRYAGSIKRAHLVYDYACDVWRAESELPYHCHHGGCRATVDRLYWYLGTVGEERRLLDATLRCLGSRRSQERQHSNIIMSWDGEQWAEKKRAPKRRMNFGTIVTDIGPVSVW